MNIFNPDSFIEKLASIEEEAKQDYHCPFCNGQEFTTTDNFDSLIIGKDLKKLSLGPTLPAGMLICTKCGHIDLFSLGLLGLLSQEEDSNNGNNGE